MAVETTGSVYSSDAENRTNNNLSVTIPADADMAVVVGMTYNESVDADFDVLCWDAGSTLDFDLIALADGTDNNQSFAYYMLSNDGDWPGDGAKTLQFSYGGSNDPSYGSRTVCFFLKGVDITDAIIGTDTEVNTSSGTWNNDSVGTVGADDMCIICGCDYGGSTLDIDVNSQTPIYENVPVEDNSHAIGVKLNDDTLQCVHNEYFGGVAFGVLAAAAGGGNAPTGVLYGALVGPMGGPL